MDVGRPKKVLESKGGTPRQHNYRTKYEQSSLEKALEALKQNKDMTVRDAAEEFSVPKSTLHDRLKVC